MKEIANMVGVSVVTVSRAFNNRPDISKETREKILSIAEQYNFVPNQLAKSLVTQSTKTIGVVITELQDLFLSTVLQGVADVIRDKGFGITLCHSYDNPDLELEYIRELRAKQVDGMLIYPTQMDERYINELKNCPIPYVFLNRHTNALHCDYVTNDNEDGMYQATNHIIEKGYRKIVYLCAKPLSSSGQERILGLQKAMRENGVAPNNFHLENCKGTIESSYQKVKKLLAQSPKIDVIFAWDDRLAIGAIKAIHEANLSIPEDIALVGYDDTEIAQYLTPSLTTVRQPSKKIGELAANILFEKIQSKKPVKVRQIVLKPELIVRSSTDSIINPNVKENLNHLSSTHSG